MNVAFVLNTIGWGLITDFVSTHAVDQAVERLAARTELHNDLLQAALQLAFIQAQQQILAESLHLPGLSANDRELLRQRLDSLGREGQSLMSLGTVALAAEAPIAISVSAKPAGEEVMRRQADLAARLLAAGSPGLDGELPRIARDRLRQGLIDWMARYFMAQVRSNDAVFRVLSTEMSTLALRNQKDLGAELKRLLANLLELVRPSPSTGYKSVPVGLKQDHYVARPALEAGIDAAFTQHGAVVLCGPGGVGKTQAAVRYAQTHWDGYRFIIWLHAEDPAVLASEYAAAALRLGLSHGTPQPQEDAIAAVHDWLERTPSWLLIFDHATGAEALVPKYLPHNPDRHVLITSRSAQWEGVAPVVPVGRFEREESVAYLQAAAGQKEPEAAAALAGELGDLPLALAQAAAFAAGPSCTLADYLDRFRTMKGQLQHQSEVRGANETVATTWAVSLSAMQAAAPAAMDLLRFCAFLAPSQIPLELLELKARLQVLAAKSRRDNSGGATPVHPDLREWSEADLSAQTRQTEILESSVRWLCQHSFMDGHPESRSVSIHRLVQELIRTRTGDDLKPYRKEAIRALTLAFPAQSQEPKAWPVCRRLLPHVEKCLGYLESQELEEDVSSALRGQVGLYLMRVGDFGRAVTYLSRAVAVQEKVYGPEQESVGFGHVHLGAAMKAAGRYQDAQSHLEKALAIISKRYGADSAETAPIHQQLGSVMSALGSGEQALAHADKALAIFRATCPAEDGRVGAAHSDMGLVLDRLGRRDQALRQYYQALTIMKKVHGFVHPEAVQTVSKAGACLSALGRYKDALTFQLQALDIAGKLYGPQHPELAKIHGDAGATYESLAEHQAALEHLRKGLAIREEQGTQYHPHTWALRFNMGAALAGLGQHQEALTEFQLASDTLEKAYGSSHPDLDLIHAAMAASLKAVQDQSQVVQPDSEEAAIASQAPEADEPDPAAAAAKVGMELQARGQHEEALECLKKALVLWAKARRSEDPAAARVREGLARSLKALGRHEEALLHFEQLVEISASLWGPGHPAAAASRYAVAESLTALGRRDQALPYLQQCLPILESHLGSRHPMVLHIHRVTGAVLESMGRHEEALDHLRRGR